ncbi:MAG: hypothetical protein JO199_01385 [Candidatus Eremiobacteraeota bacterium]|nr:hypothetical protein [Candidatus Eremiobacteraeota bacterium]
MQTSASSVSPPLWAQLLPLAVIMVILTIRFLRPQRISITRMWLQPIVLCFLVGWLVYATYVMNPAPVWEIGLGMVAGLLAGIPFGILRGWHTDVRPTDKPGVMYLGSSWITMAIFLVAFGFRFTVRQLMPHTGGVAAAIGDGVLGFAIAFAVTSYVVIYRKYKAEMAGRLASAPAPPP